MDFSLTSYQRFRNRCRKHIIAGKGLLRLYFWWTIHNMVAHPLIGLIPNKLFFEFHDYTSDKINLVR